MPSLLLAWLMGCPAPEDTATESSCVEGEVLDGSVCVPEHCGTGVYGVREGDVYVDSLNLGEQDGSRDRPYADLSFALLEAERDQTVVLAGGLYKGLVRMDLAQPGVRLVGRCKELTTLDGDGELVTVFGEITGTHVEHVTITGALEAGVFSFDETAILRDVDLVRPGYVGFWVADVGDALLERVRVIDPVADPDYGSAWGITATDLSSLTLRDVTVENAIDAGVFLEGAGAFDADGLVITGTTPKDAGSGSGLVALRSGPIHIRNCTVLDNHLAGLLFEPDSPALVENCLIEGVKPSAPSEVYAAGVLAVDSEVTVRDTLVRDVHGTGAEVYGLTGSLWLERVDIENTYVDDESYASGFGLTVREGTLVASEVTLRDTMAVGAWVSHGGYAELKDVVIEGVVSGPSNPATAGVYTRVGGQAVLTRVEIRDLQGNGVSVGPGTVIQADDLLVEGIGANSPGTGRCIEVEDGTLTLEHAELRDCLEVAVLASGAEAVVELDQVVIHDIGATEDYAFGLGVLAQDGALLTGTDVDISNTASSAGAAALNGVLVLQDSRIHDTRLNDDHTLGYALFATSGGHITLEDSVVSSAGQAGVLANGLATSVVLRGVEVSEVYVGTGADTAFGALVQDDATLSLVDVSVSNIEGPALACSSGGTLVSTGLEVDSVRFAGLVLQGCDATLEDTHIEGVSPDPQAGGGLGVYIDGVGHGPGETLVDDLVVRDVVVGGVVSEGDGTLELSALNVHGGPGVVVGPSTLNGHGLLLRDCGDTTVLDSELWNGQVGLFLHNCAPQIQGLAFRDNVLDVQQQACSEPIDPPQGATSVDCPQHDSLLLDLNFDATVAEPELKE
jgi:hypothetical protein